MASARPHSGGNPVVRALALVDAAVGWVAGLAMLAVVATIFVNASGRYLIGFSFLGGEELARLLTVWITFVGAYIMVRRDGHVSIDLALRVMTPGLQRAARGAVGVVGVATMTYLAWTAWQLCAFSFGTGQTGTTLPVPRALFFLPVLVGAVLMGIAFAEKVVRAVTGTLEPLPALAEEAAAATGGLDGPDGGEAR
ncbi:MAG: TRAP transporter small permease [Azospirillaceae bacterium]